LDLEKCKDQVLFCITHADGWNDAAKQRYLSEFLDNSGLEVSPTGCLDRIVFIGAPDPSKMEGRGYTELAKEQEAEARETLLKYLPVGNPSILNDKITEWRNLDAKKQLSAALEKAKNEEKKRNKNCFIL
jgi:hypothetical protein